MPRDDEALKVTIPWAGEAEGNRAAVPDGLREDGWGEEYSQVGGLPGPERLYFNQVVYELSKLVIEINQYGLPLPWSDKVDYKHTAFVMGADGRMYRSQQDSGPGTFNARDPVEDTDNAYWRIY